MESIICMHRIQSHRLCIALYFLEYDSSGTMTCDKLRRLKLLTALAETLASSLGLPDIESASNGPEIFAGPSRSIDQNRSLAFLILQISDFHWMETLNIFHLFHIHHTQCKGCCLVRSTSCPNSSSCSARWTSKGSCRCYRTVTPPENSPYNRRWNGTCWHSKYNLSVTNTWATHEMSMDCHVHSVSTNTDVSAYRQV